MFPALLVTYPRAWHDIYLSSLKGDEMKTTRGFVLTALAVVIALVWCGQALAQASAEDGARAQFDTGVELFEKGQFAQASIAFARAYELRPSYKILYLVGKCENEQGHFALSLDAYTRYLAEAGDKIEQSRRDEVRAAIARLNSRVGSVSVETNVEGVTVLVDGRKSGTTPLPGPVFVDLGEHEVKLARGADEVYREIVKVAGGQRVVVKAEIGGHAEAKDVPEAPAPAAPVAAPEIAPKAAAETAPAPAPEAAAETAPTPAPEAAAEAAPIPAPDAAPPAENPKRIWTWVAFGVGGAAAIGAAITGGIYISKSNDVKDQCSGSNCPSSVGDDLDSAKTLGNATTALIAVAGVGLAAGIVLYFVEPKWSDESAVEVAPVAAPTADGAVLALVGRF